jgi:hypothetical protein
MARQVWQGRARLGWVRFGPSRQPRLGGAAKVNPAAFVSRTNAGRRHNRYGIGKDVRRLIPFRAETEVSKASGERPAGSVLT